MGTDFDLILKKYKQGKREDLIPLIQEIQEKLGYLSEEAIVKVGSYLGLSTTKIYGLATFYDRFRFIPAGNIQIKVCNGTSCYLNGSQSIINKITEETGVLPGQTTRDGNFSYEIVSCMGGCHNGPVLNVNGEYHTCVKASQLSELLKKLKYLIEND
ncbi:MAG TPA: NAD(P)H-dependent oxidoreductase subunit E [Bacteroidales bacterium]|nr:NAD(P)H-dependent oxidoreductase subunit E [Bacteroidales bacterium]